MATTLRIRDEAARPARRRADGNAAHMQAHAENAAGRRPPWERRPARRVKTSPDARLRNGRPFRPLRSLASRAGLAGGRAQSKD
jgi:hypothetical protein